MSATILGSWWLTGAQSHNPGPLVHVLLLAGIVVSGLVIFALTTWRRRHGSAPHEHPEERGPRPAERPTRYALLVYDLHDSWQSRSSEEKRAVHDEYRALSAASQVVGHYRLRHPRTSTTVRVEDERAVATQGPLAEATPGIRAIYVLESGSWESVVEIAASLPAARAGGAVEVWPLVER